MQIPPNLKTDDAIARYWTSTASRGEVQAVFDDFSQFSVKMKEQLLKLDFAIAYLIERFNVTPEEIKAFMDKKVLEFAEMQKAKEDSEKENSATLSS